MKQTSKQNINRDFQIKNRLMVTRSGGRGIVGKIGEESPRNTYKGHMDKSQRGWMRVGGWDAWGRGDWWRVNGDNCT